MKKFIYIFIVALAFAGSSCNDFLSVNETNPNSASSVAPRLVLPACLNSVATVMNSPRNADFVYLWHGLWSISAGYTQPADLTQYRLRNSSYQGVFLNLYTTAKNLDAIEKGATDPKDAYFVAIAKIMKGYIFQNLVDLWGDVPYTEAFQTDAGNLKPKYDKQQAIYEDLVVQLDAAIGLIQNATADANAVPALSDIIYQGNMSKWLKFANTLKLRILLHQADMAGRTSYITTAIATTASVGYLGAGESALNNPGYLVSAGKMNPFYEYFYKSDGSAQSDATTYYFAGYDVVNYMTSTNDTRIGKFFLPYSGTKYGGNVFGKLAADLTSSLTTSKLGYSKDDASFLIGSATKSTPILTDFESLFIQAEAAQRGLITGDVKALYEGAVTQSFLYMGLSSASAANFLAQPTFKTNIDLSTNKLDLILTQKWVALNGIAPFEIWTDYRRTGIPTFITYSPEPNREKDFPPIRLLYPQNELDVNNDNVVAVGTIDAFTTKIFWQNR
jgi:hypothetical protein